VTRAPQIVVAIVTGVLAQVTTAHAVDLRFDPALLQVDVGARVLVAVRAEGVPLAGLAGFQFDVVFDPTVIQLHNPNEAFRGSVDPFAPLGGNPICSLVRGTSTCTDPPWFLISTGRVPVGTDDIDNATGRISIAYGTGGAPAPPSGDGVIALIEVRGNAVGSSTLAFEDVVLVDDGDPPNDLPVTLLGATVDVTASIPQLPRPAWALFAALLAATSWALRQRS